jgi:hypothetical protein
MIRTLATDTHSTLVGTFTSEGPYTRFRAVDSDTSFLGTLTEGGDGRVTYALVDSRTVYVGQWA